MIVKRNTERVIRNKSRIATISDNASFALSQAQLRSTDLFCYGFILYTLSVVIASLGILLPAAVVQGFETVALIMIITAAVSLMRFKFDSKYLEIVFKIYIIFSMSIILRNGKYDYNTIKILFFHMMFSVFTYFVPFVLLFPRNLRLYKKLVNISVVFAVISLLFAIVYYRILHSFVYKDLEGQAYVETYCYCFVLPLGFLLLTYIYYKDSTKLLALGAMVLCLYFVIFRARRGSMFMCASTLAATAVMYLIYTKRRALVVTLSIVLLLVSTVFMSNIKLPHMFDSFVARKDEDTRTYVEESMKADMKPMDWVIGKGINGTYSCYIEGEGYLNGQRSIIETGYLQIILKGGLVSIILLGMILLPAIYLGFFKSSNILSKGAAMFILLWIVFLYPTVVNGFTLLYIMLWISVGICYSAKLRSLQDKVIKKYLYN